MAAIGIAELLILVVVVALIVCVPVALVLVRRAGRAPAACPRCGQPLGPNAMCARCGGA